MAIVKLEQEIKDKALELGFDAVGITDASPVGREHIEHFETWLQRGYAGRMDYMHHNLDKRIDPARLRRGAESVIVVALNYKPQEPVVERGVPNVECGNVALYAQYEDYHAFIKSLLRELAAFICVKTRGTDRYKICVDSAPIAEKAIAARAGLGFIGRNHLLIHRQLGPQLLLGELLTTICLEPDEPVAGTCSDCSRCIKACPTGALRPDGFLDARKCISYRTQYDPGNASGGAAGPWVFGCDECLLACPFHRDAPQAANRQFRFYPERATVDLREALELDEATFQKRFFDSPVKRSGLEMLRQNARACLRCLAGGQ